VEVCIHSPMSATVRPPALEFARPGANPTLESIEYVRAIFRQAEIPISRNQILRVLASWGHSMTRKSLNSIVGFLGAEGAIVEGSKGLTWVPNAFGTLAEAIDKGRRL
jgi:hypothetical protein